MTQSVGIYPEWHTKPWIVRVKDPDRGIRSVYIAAAVGPYDARSQAAFLYPLSEYVEDYPAPEGER